MSAGAVRDVLQRAIDDAAFRERLARDPDGALAEYDLTPEERARFIAGTLTAERLEERLSKTDLSAALSAKASAPTLRRPSRGKRDR